MMHFLNQPSLALPASLTSTQASQAVDCQNMSKVSFQVSGTGTFSATAQIQVSNDGVNWVGLGTPTALAVGSIMVEKVDLTQKWVRLNIAYTSGTVANLSVVFNGKF